MQSPFSLPFHNWQLSLPAGIPRAHSNAHVRPTARPAGRQQHMVSAVAGAPCPSAGAGGQHPSAGATGQYPSVPPQPQQWWQSTPAPAPGTQPMQYGSWAAPPPPPPPSWRRTFYRALWGHEYAFFRRCFIMAAFSLLFTVLHAFRYGLWWQGMPALLSFLVFGPFTVAMWPSIHD